MKYSVLSAAVSLAAWKYGYPVAAGLSGLLSGFLYILSYHAVSHRIFLFRIDAYRNCLVNFNFRFACDSSSPFIFYKNKRKIFLDTQKQDPLRESCFLFYLILNLYNPAITPIIKMNPVAVPIRPSPVKPATR